VEVWAIVVAGGTGSRFGGIKQYESLGDRRVLDWSIDRARGIADGVIVVVPASRVDDAERGADVVVAGGAQRSASVRNGLAAVPDSADVVVVHDAARPMASAELFRAVVDAVAAGADAAVPGVPIVDTVKRVRKDVVVETLDRDELVAVQTPQAFTAAALRRAHVGEPDASDDAGLVEAIGGRVAVVPGEATNVKLTTSDDLAAVRLLVAAT
jgi:2-C-methyl-D-erythritol 4-phosphate cytidylyltransferase